MLVPSASTFGSDSGVISPNTMFVKFANYSVGLIGASGIDKTSEYSVKHENLVIDANIVNRIIM